MKNATRHLDFLDGTRGVAILAVLLFHTLGLSFGFDALPWHGVLRDFSVQSSFFWFLPVGMIGQAGVAIFFVVSGFCVHLSFQRQGKEWGGFFVRRFFRIYPPYLLALAFSFLILAINPGLDVFSGEFWKQLLTHVFLVHNLSADTYAGVNASLWSLAVEAQLYLLYPVLLAVVAKRGWWRGMWILAVCELGIRAVDGVCQTADVTNSIGGQAIQTLANSPLGYWFSWAIGAYIAEAWLKGEPLPFLKISPYVWLCLALGAYFIKPLCSLQFLLFAMTAAAFISRFLGDDSEGKQPGLWGRMLTKIGLWSYSIYLLHQPLLHVYSHVIVWAVPAEHRPAPVNFLLLVGMWAVVVLLSLLWYKMIELPGIALGKKFAGSFVHGSKPARPVPDKGSAPAATSRAGYGLMTVALLASVAVTLLVSDRFSYRRAVENCRQAWVLATSSDATQRDGSLAVKLAEDACIQTHYQEPVMVGTLAAAYAEAGRFDEAVGASQMACNLASRAGDQIALQKNQDMLQHFLKREPYRQQ